MNILKKHLTTFIAYNFLLLFLLWAEPSLAGDINPQKLNLSCLQTAINWHRYFSGIICLASLLTAVLGAVRWLVHIDNIEQVAQAKQWIINGMIGICIASASYMALFIINNSIR